ncbi:MAG: hypothetical protein PHO10_09795 [Gemmiger sp.]|nr:hypothetical protein [Gemmiger sp.]
MPSYNEPSALIEQNENFHTPKYYLTVAALVIILVAGLLAALGLGKLAPTFNGKVDVATLQNDPTAYTTEGADGAAYVIVAKNLAETNAKNICFSVVFNFRGYDTMGESFILIAALAGSLCILREPKHGDDTPNAKQNGKKAGKQSGKNAAGRKGAN